MDDLLRLINGYRVSQALHVAATLRLSDHLADVSLTAAELAAATETDPSALSRLMRALVTVGVYAEHEDGTFTCTELGEGLRADALGGWAAFIGRPSIWQAWGALEHSVRTGENAFTAVHGTGVWDYRAAHPEEGVIFDAAMTSIAEHIVPAVLDAYDFRAFHTVADIGGGTGALLAAILDRHESLRGILFDQPHVVAAAAPIPRCDVVAGDVFASIPAGADAYLMKSILHDWPDDKAVAILEVCRRTMSGDAVLLVIEQVLTGPSISAAFSDLNMLVGPGGQERTPEEYAKLFSRAGLHLTRIVPTASSVSLVEARIA